MISDRSHVWHADGGIANYNPVQFEEQIVNVPFGAKVFKLTMDLSEDNVKGRVGGISTTTVDLDGENVSEIIMQEALSRLENIGQVQVSSSQTSNSYQFTITFASLLGEIPLLSPSDENVSVTRKTTGLTEIQTVTLSSSKAFIYEVQTISLLNSDETFSLSFNSSMYSNAIQSLI